MRWAAAALLCVLAAPVHAAPRIQAIGDSVLTWNGANAIPEVAGRILGEPVQNNARAGSKLRQGNILLDVIGLDIPGQFRPGAWDWVIVNGGANDLNGACRCAACDAEIDALIAPDGGAGLYVELVAGVLAGGARDVLILGYYGPTGRGGRVDRCADELRIVDARLARFAAATGRVHFIDADPVMGPQTPEFFGRDLVHPNARGSAAIGALVAAEIARLDPAR